MLTVDLTPHYAAFGLTITTPGKPDELGIPEEGLDFDNSEMQTVRVMHPTQIVRGDKITMDGQSLTVVSVSRRGDYGDERLLSLKKAT